MRGLFTRRRQLLRCALQRYARSDVEAKAQLPERRGGVDDADVTGEREAASVRQMPVGEYAAVVVSRLRVYMRQRAIECARVCAHRQRVTQQFLMLFTLLRVDYYDYSPAAVATLPFADAHAAARLPPRALPRHCRHVIFFTSRCRYDKRRPCHALMSLCHMPCLCRIRDAMRLLLMRPIDMFDGAARHAF